MVSNPGDWMKLCRFVESNRTRIGRIVDGEVIDLSVFPGVTGSMREFIAELPSRRAAIESADGPRFSMNRVRLAAPINDPQKYLAIGMNYKAHADEAAAAGHPVPTSQLWFNKQTSCINGPYDIVRIPNVSDKIDYEAELAFVIGRRCRRVSAKEARQFIAGYMVANDVSVRDWQLRSPTFTLGKSFDTHGPIGPWLTTDDEIADPHALNMWLTVNGEERQRTSTADMIYNIYAQIEYLSTAMTLEPGDIIATGTPSGVGIARNQFLKAGDVVRVEIDKLGAIENQFLPE
jgi:2-keto-4-pentenoate hydratase/2-oxohepta-3-ene-1,7-dioic acid hydratase in catechol pathway